jgi:hypothetical protein
MSYHTFCHLELATALANVLANDPRSSLAHRPNLWENEHVSIFPVYQPHLHRSDTGRAGREIAHLMVDREH